MLRRELELNPEHKRVHPHTHRDRKSRYTTCMTRKTQHMKTETETMALTGDVGHRGDVGRFGVAPPDVVLGV